MNQRTNNPPFAKLNRLLFPMVYGQGSKENSLADGIFNLAIIYAEDKDECIFKKDKERNIIAQSLKKSSLQSSEKEKSLVVVFRCEYGCAIKLTKDNQHSPINIQIILLEKWATGAHNANVQKLQYVNPQGQLDIFIPNLPIHDESLTSFAKRFQRDLNTAFHMIVQREQKKDKTYVPRSTAKQIQQACKLAASKYSLLTKPTLLQEQKQQKEQQQKQQRVNTIGQQFSLEKSQADVSWYICKAIIENLLGNEKEQKLRANKFITGFRGWILKKATAQAAEVNRQEIEKYKLCLDEIVLQYKHKVSKYCKKIQKFNALITNIERNIIKMKGGRLTSKIQNKQNFYKKLDIGVKEKPQINTPQLKKHKKQQLKEMQISDFMIEVDRRYAFEILLDLYHKINKSNQGEISKWILLTEKTIFSYTPQLSTKNKTIDLNIHMRQIESEIGASTMGEVVLCYEQEISKKQTYYGLLLEGQVKSHIQLIRAIIAVIAFESVKLNRERKKSNLFEYRVPFDIEELFNNFHSNSRQARKAMKFLRIYNESRKGLKKIFELNQLSNSFYAFGREVAKQTRSALAWLESMKKLNETEKQLQANKLLALQYQDRLKRVEICSNNVFGGINNIQNALASVSPFQMQSPCAYFDQNDQYIYAFINNIPPDVLGMIKSLFFAQNPVLDSNTLKQETNVFFTNKLFQNQKFPIKIYSEKTSIARTVQIQEPIKSDSPSKNVYLYYGNSILCTNYQKIQFYSEVDKFYCRQENETVKSVLKRFLSPPEPKTMTRQHQVYANMTNKPIEMDLQMFQAMANVRSAEHTQLILLCSGILQRKIISNSYDQQSLFAQRLILQTGGRLSAYHKQTEKYFKKIEKLIGEFLDVWAFTDTRFCPILAPLLSFLAREISDDQLINEQKAKILTNIHFELSKKCLQEFRRTQKQLKEDPILKVQWDQRFVCMAAICCFREVQLASDNDEQLIFLLELIFQLRVTKILSDRESRPAKKRLFQQQLEFHIEKAIYRNIGAISQFIDKDHEQLCAIVRRLDDSLPDDIVWAKVNLFHFRGVSQESGDIYQLNIFGGNIYKNGKEISCLDQKIKKNPYYRQIFGKDREFQVFPSREQHYLRTKDNFNFQFKINEKQGKVFFQFSQDGEEIRHVIKKQGKKLDEQIWTLIPRNILQKAKCHIPKIYFDNHLAWFSARRKCIAFRKPMFDSIYEIGMVIFLDLTGPISTITGASHITYHGSYEDQMLDDICNSGNPKYQEIILRNNSSQLKSITPYKVLLRFEKPQFIIELQNRKSKEIYYWLHRYQLKFKVVKETRLLSQTYFGYALDHSYYDAKSCIFNKFPCLVLQKFIDSQTIANSHKKIIIISQGTVELNGKILKNFRDEQNAQKHFKSYKYDIHDFFGDIRGINRVSILHLAAIMLSINDNIKIESIQMTPLQYAIYLMKSCFTNRPLTSIEFQILKNIIKLGSAEVILLAEALWKMANSLQQILPFPSDSQNGTSFFVERDRQKFAICRTLYEKSAGEDLIRFREKINKDILLFLGMNEAKAINKTNEKPDSSSEEFDYNEIFWKGQKIYTGENLIQIFDAVHDSYKQFQQQTLKLNIWNQQAAKQVNDQFPQQINELSSLHKNDEMMKEMIGELTNSFQVYCKEEARITQIASKINKEQKAKQINIIKDLKKQALVILDKIEENIKKVKDENEQHPDAITGNRPSLSPAMYTSILCEKDLILQYYPHLCKKAASMLLMAMKIWLQLKTRTASFERIEYLLTQDKIDVVAIMREVLSPREVVFQKNQWLCFEAQMKVQLWPSQLETYNNLMKQQKSGSFCQLNMGEGKTQVIIPLIILNTIYSNKNNSKCLPRITLLSSLFQQARGNFFRFISATGFQIPAFQLPFNRKVALKKNNLHSIKHLIDSFSNKAYILMTRESRLSQILRFHQGKIIGKAIKQNVKNREAYLLKDKRFQFDLTEQDCNKSLIKNEIFDVFDEIDALMYAKKSYIFSIGDHLDLAHDMMRFQVLRVCIEVFLSKYLKTCLEEKIAVTDQTNQDAIDMMKKGEYPVGLRLIFENADSKRIFQFRRSIARTIVFELNRHQYSFKNFLKTDKQKEDLLEYIINPEVDDKKGIPSKIPDASKPQIFILRGALAYGIFEHCLSMRCGVDFGVPNSFHIKRIAVPYQAADIPSKTSEYEQPDVSTLLSYIAYYTKGLSEKYFQDCLKALLELSKTSKELEYQQWIQILDQESKENLQMKNVEKINYNSKVHREYLFKTFRKNRKTIAFWLIKCVFLKDLKQYAKSICSSAWDLADVKKSVGFSGTKDNRWLYSNLLTWKPCQTPQILGTDGKMIHLITKHTKQVALIEQNNKTLWQRFIDLALDRGVGCIIDAGALCVGKSLKDQIVPWIAEHQKFNSQRFVGISFCDSRGQWFVYDIQGKYYIPRGTTIPDHQTFVVFDQARTRGADLKMDGDIVAALSLGPELTKDSLMQAAGRLRKLGRNQSLIIMATQQVFAHFRQFPKSVKQYKKSISQINAKDKEKLPRLIIAWCCENSIRDNHDLLMQFAQLGWKYIYSKLNKRAHEQQLTTDLSIMYSKTLAYEFISALGKKAEKTKGELAAHQSGKFILNVLEKYGQTVRKQAGSLDDVCERQVQAEKEKQKQQQNQLTVVKAIPEVDKPDILTVIKAHPFNFDPKFRMTSNLIKTTESPTLAAKNQIPDLYFLKINAKEIVAVSIREASIFIEKNIIRKEKEGYQIFMINSLGLESAIIKQNKLQGALVSAKFLSGVENYTVEEQNHLIKQLLDSLQMKKEWQDDYNAVVSLFLRQKRVYLKKFKGSTLEKMILRMNNKA